MNFMDPFLQIGFRYHKHTKVLRRDRFLLTTKSIGINDTDFNDIGKMEG